MKKILFFIVLTFAILAAAIYFNLDLRENITKKAYGIIDIRESMLGFERAGRIDALLKDEGDFVKKGEILAVLDTSALKYQKSIQSAQCEGLRANLNELINGYRPEEIEAASANVQALENSFNLARLTNDRMQILKTSNSASKQQIDEAFYAMKQAKAQLDSARANLNQLQNGYRSEDIDAARANLLGCEENLKYLDYQINDQSVLKAPYDGQIRARLKELGDMSVTSSAVFELSDVKNKRARFYLSETQLGFVKAGNEVKIIAADGATASAKIAYISQSAMFTPRTVQTEELRADLVWEVRADFIDEEAKFRLGQPISVEF